MSLNSIHNFYEAQVIRHVQAAYGGRHPDPDYLADLACVALNHLPPRYVRFDVDTIFYMTAQERAELERRIDQVVREAVIYIAIHRGERQAAQAPA
jgi:hypothetical protein